MTTNRFSQPVPDDAVIIFPHCFSVGGGSLYTTIKFEYGNPIEIILKSLLGEQLYFSDSYPCIQQYGEDIGIMENLERADVKKLKMIYGHYRFGLHQHLERPFEYFTIIRNPVDRVLSSYRKYYIKVTNEKTEKLKTLEEHIISEAFMKNHQTQYLVASEFSMGEWVNPIKVLNSNSTEILEVAKQNLKNYFGVIGVMDRYEETLFLLKNRYKWKTYPFYANVFKAHKNQQGPVFSNEDIQLASDYNALDIELYKYANILFEEQLKLQPASFYQQITKFKSINKYVENFICMAYEIRTEMKKLRNKSY